jgi:hypothetical protein
MNVESDAFKPTAKPPVQMPTVQMTTP